MHRVHRIHLTSHSYSLDLASGQDGFGKFLDVNDVAKVVSIQKHASQTVMHTFLLLMTLDRIPNMSSVAGRKKAVQELKDRIGSKAFSEKKEGSVSKSIVKRVNELNDGKVFDRIDFEKLKAEKEKLAKEKAKENEVEQKQPIVDAVATTGGEAVQTDLPLSDQPLVGAQSSE